MFRVVTAANMYNGKWLVIRESDRRIMTQCVDPREGARWIKTWGDTFGKTKAGSALSPHFPLD